MARFRFSFLPVFFVCLTIVFGIALVLKLRSERFEPSSMPAARPAPQETVRPVVRPPAVHRKQEVEDLSSPAPASTPTPATATVAPESNAIEAVWFDPRSIRTGQADALHVRFASTVSVTQIRGSLVSASRTARLPLTCSGTGALWTCSVSVPACIACGRWSIEQLSIERRNGAPIELSANLKPSVQLWADRCDSEPPALHAIAMSGDDIVFTVSDTGCGVASVKATAASGGETTSLAAQSSGDGDTWTAHTTSIRARRGAWHLQSVEVADSAGNTRTYAETDPLLKNAAVDH